MILANSGRAVRVLGFVALVVLSAQAFVPAYAQSYTMTLQTDASSYSGSQPITISGTISPAPPANSAVVIAIKDSGGSLADIADESPNTSTGQFSYVSVPGGNAAWTSGTYTVNATFGGPGVTSVSQVVTFTYTAGSTTTTSSTSSTTSTSTTTSSSQTSTTAAPEFPASAVGLLALLAMAIVAVAVRAKPLQARTI